MARGGAPTSKWPSLPPQKPSYEPGDPKQVGAKLIVRRPEVPEVEIPLEKPEFVIGRQPSGVDLTLDDELVSRRHARLTMDARGYFKLEDLGSRNGIHYAGRMLRRLNLVDGDKFSIGKTEFEFHARMDRFKKLVAPPPRHDSVFVDILIPRPEADAPMIEEPSVDEPGRALLDDRGAGEPPAPEDDGGSPGSAEAGEA